jgi:hypothetical protein
VEPVALIQELGLEVTIIIGGAFAFWKIVLWLQGTLLKHIDQIATSNIKNEEETKGILIKLIDRIRALQTDIIRLDTLLRVKKDLPVDERRIERNQKED